MAVLFLFWVLLGVDLVDDLLQERLQLLFLSASTAKLFDDGKKLLLDFLEIGDSLGSEEGYQSVEFALVLVLGLIHLCITKLILDLWIGWLD